MLAGSLILTVSLAIISFFNKIHIPMFLFYQASKKCISISLLLQFNRLSGLRGDCLIYNVTLYFLNIVLKGRT